MQYNWIWLIRKDGRTTKVSINTDYVDVSILTDEEQAKAGNTTIAALTGSVEYIKEDLIHFSWDGTLDSERIRNYREA